MPVIPEREALVEELARLYRAADANLRAELAAVEQDPTKFRRQARLNELLGGIESSMDDLDVAADRWLSSRYPDVYALGATEGALYSRRPFRWTQESREAVAVLAADTYEDLLKATKHVRKDAKALIRDLTRQTVAGKLVEGRTATQAGRELSRLLNERGVKAVTYRNGARHGIGEYGQMVVRTKSAVAYNEGLFAQAPAAFYEVFDGAGCGLVHHDDPIKANGKIKAVAWCRAHPISHPNAVMIGTFTSYGRVEEMVRARYLGPAVALSIGPHEATVGPNHPVLTAAGWVPARCLREGDELVYDRRVELTTAGHAPGPLDLEQAPRLEDAFETLRSAGSYSIVPATRDDLHGDAWYVEDEIEVVRPVGDLLAVWDAGGIEKGGKLDLSLSDAELALLTGAGSELPPLDRVDVAAPRRVRLPSSGPYELRRLTEVRVVAYEGHAYDATAIGSLYCVSGLVVSNCRRSFGPRPDVETEEDAGKAEPSTTAEQRADQQAFEEKRAADLARRANARARRDTRAGAGRGRAAKRQEKAKGRRTPASTPQTAPAAWQAHLDEALALRGEGGFLSRKGTVEGTTTFGKSELDPKYVQHVDRQGNVLTTDQAANFRGAARTMPTKAALDVESSVLRAGGAVDEEIVSRLRARGIKSPDEARAAVTEVEARRRALSVEIEALNVEISKRIDVHVAKGELGIFDDVKELQERRRPLLDQRDIVRTEEIAGRARASETTKAYREELRAMLVERGRRPGEGRVNLTGSKATQATLQNALDYYPAALVDPSGSIEVGVSVRGFHVEKPLGKYRLSGGRTVKVNNEVGAAEIRLTKGSQRSIVEGDPEMLSVGLHEYGHHVEQLFPELRRLEWVFGSRRSARLFDELGGILDLDDLVPIDRLNKKLGRDSNYGSKEQGREDKWAEPYMGKEYNASNTPSEYREVFSMTVEGLLTGSQPMDPELRSFALAILFLL